MSTELAARPKDLDRCAADIRTAQHKAKRWFAEYIQIVGSELEKAQRLLADHHAGFGQWVRDEFGWTHQQANRLIAAAETMRLLEPMGSSKNLPLPDSERQCRPLASLPAEDVSIAWERVCDASEQAGKPITAAAVKAVVDELLPGSKPAAKPRKPAAKKAAEMQADEEVEPDRMLDEISYYALAFLNACPDRADELEGLLLTWVSRCKQR